MGNINPLRHVGKLANTDTRVAVIFMQLPDKPDHALVVSTDNLNPRLELALMDVINSNEAQGEPILANVLSRKIVPEGGKNILQALHDANVLRAVHIDQVIMMPRPNMPFPLREVLEKTGKLDFNPVTTPVPSVDKFGHNDIVTDIEDRTGVAKNLLVQAELLEADALAKRKQAYRIAPELEPKVKPEILVQSDVSKNKPKKVRSSSKISA